MFRIVVLAFLVVLFVDNEQWQLNALTFLWIVDTLHWAIFSEWRLTLI